MRELGTASPELHREAGQFAAKTGKIDWIIGVAGDAAQIVEGAVAADSRANAPNSSQLRRKPRNFWRALSCPAICCW